MALYSLFLALKLFLTARGARPGLSLDFTCTTNLLPPPLQLEMPSTGNSLPRPSAMSRKAKGGSRSACVACGPPLCLNWVWWILVRAVNPHLSLLFCLICCPLMVCVLCDLWALAIVQLASYPTDLAGVNEEDVG